MSLSDAVRNIMDQGRAGQVLRQIAGCLEEDDTVITKKPMPNVFGTNVGPLVYDALFPAAGSAPCGQAPSCEVGHGAEVAPGVEFAPAEPACEGAGSSLLAEVLDLLERAARRVSDIHKSGPGTVWLLGEVLDLLQRAETRVRNVHTESCKQSAGDGQRSPTRFHSYTEAFGQFCERVNQWAHSKGWRQGPGNIQAELLNITSEVAEASEELRHGRLPTEIYYAPDNPTKPLGVPIELADVIIRVADTCAAYGINLGYAIETKFAYNETRPYRHGGKAY